MEFNDLQESATFVSTPWGELPTEHQIESMSGGEFEDAEEIMGEEPDSYERHKGNLVVTGNLCLDRPNSQRVYVIDGNVSIEGTLCLTCWDMYNVVIITGGLRAHAVVLDSDVHLYVAGTTTLSGPLVAALSDGGFARFGEATRAAALVVTNDNVSIDGDPETTDELDAAAFPEHATLMERLDTGTWRQQ